MKIEFVKEEKLNGDVFYFTTIDGKYIEGSLTLNEEKGYDIYNRVKINRGDKNLSILETFDTEQTPN